MDSNPFQDDVLNRFVSFSDWDSLDPIQCVKAIHYATKNRELVIKVGCRCVGYEELAPNRVWAFSSEPHNAPSVVFQIIHELISHRTPMYRFPAALASAGGVSPLQHELID